MRSAAAALAHALAKTSFTRDLCMRSVLDDYDLIPTNVTLGADYENAMEGWARSNQHTDRNWKIGAPLYFRGPNGHTCLGMAGGMVRSTTPGSTSMITCSLDEIIRLSGDPYLGWSDTFNGVPINFTSTAGGGATPFPDPVIPLPKGGNDMPILYHKQSTVGEGKTNLFALAGTSPGTPANWTETTALGLANQWAEQLGSAQETVNGFSAGLNDATWDLYRTNYLAALNTTATVKVGDITIPAQDDKAVLAALATLTTAVRLIGTPEQQAAAFFAEQKKAGN